MSENIKKGIRNWLQVNPSGYSLMIQSNMDHELYSIRNRVWWRGIGYELQQFYMSVSDDIDKDKFWASKCSEGMSIRKLHVGIPSLIVRVLANIVLSDMYEPDFDDERHKSIWDSTIKENKLFSKMLKKALQESLVIGDGAFKIAIDTSKSQYSILQWYPGDRVEFEYDTGRPKEIIFKTPYNLKNRQQYVLHEHYGYGYIESHLYKGEDEVPLDAIDATKHLKPRVDFITEPKIMLAVPLMVYESAIYEGRGGSIFDGKLDSFDAVDEAWSQWMDALRSGRSKTYIPSNLIPRDPMTGALLKPNPFDNRFIATEPDMGENSQNKIDTEQPAIPHDSYLASYVTALDLALQGLISPSTLGIDTKKLDNAEAQREKEKTTLYTRGDIIEAFKDTMEELIKVSINAYNILNKHSVEDVKVSVEWGEYANPSFESQVETVGKAKTSGIMSTEACVDELYGDSKDDTWKAEEVARLKAEQGIAVMEEPSLNMEGVIVDDSQGGEQVLPDAPGGVQ